MKRINILLFLIFIYSCSITKTKIGYWENNSVKYEYKYLGKIRFGIQKEYNEKGELIREYYYNNEKVDGIYREYYPDKTIKEILFYIEGKKHGKHLSFYETGELNQIDEFRNDTLTGSIINYYKSGKVRYTCQYCSVKCLGEIDTENNIKLYDDNQITQRESVYCGEFTAYSQNGYIKAKGHYYPGYYLMKEKKDGGIYSSVLPIRNGLWKYYDDNGNISDEEVYEMGILKK